MKVDWTEAVKQSPGSLLDVLARHLSLVEKLGETAQDPEWHAEGDVRVHTEMVIEEAQEMARKHDLSEDERLALILGAALHDIGKVLTTREAEIDGRTRIISPHHPERGMSYLAPRLPRLGIDWQVCETVLGLVRHHHTPAKFISRGYTEHRFVGLSREVNFRLVYLLETADLKGRILADSSDDRDGVEAIELFRQSALEWNLWDGPRILDEWKTVIDKVCKNEGEAAYVYGKAARDYTEGLVFSAEEAIAKYYQWRANHPELIVLCGASGSGKSTWLNECGADIERIGLDQIRDEVAGRESDQSKNGKVMQLAKERLREAFRKKRRVVWDATSLRADGRASIIDLAHSYHSRTTLIRFACPPEIAKKRNRSRSRRVPESVIDRQYERYQWPSLAEADSVKSIAVDTC